MSEETTSEPKQFFSSENDSFRSLRKSGKLAVYSVPPIKENEKPLEIMVECVGGNGTTPREAAGLPSVLDLKRELDAVAQFARLALEKLRQAEPGEVEIEFGIELGGQMGIPLITSHEAKATFKVTMKWSNDSKSTGS